MEIQGVEGMPEAIFRRLTGVRKRTFVAMVAVLKQAEVERRAGSRITSPWRRGY